MVDETRLDEPEVDETAVDKMAVDKPGPHLLINIKSDIFQNIFVLFIALSLCVQACFSTLD